MSIGCGAVGDQALALAFDRELFGCMHNGRQCDSLLLLSSSSVRYDCPQVVSLPKRLDEERHKKRDWQEQRKVQ